MRVLHTPLVRPLSVLYAHRCPVGRQVPISVITMTHQARVLLGRSVYPPVGDTEVLRQVLFSKEPGSFAGLAR
jgi:hypothetical protein